MDLAVLEAQEKAKYDAIYSTRPDYGDANHGHKAMKLLANASSVLDFGCGNNHFARALGDPPECVGWDFSSPEADVTGGVLELSEASRAEHVPYEWFTSFDTLEHIPEPLLGLLLESAATMSQWFCFSICTQRSSWGGHTDLHVTIKDWGWWKQKIGKHAAGMWEWGAARTGHPYLVGVWA